MAGYLSTRSGKKKKADTKWFVLDQEGTTLKVYKDAEGFSRKKPAEETSLLGAIVSVAGDGEGHGIKVQFPSVKEPLMLEVGQTR